MKHHQALLLANNILANMSPYCERVEIAGSVRRGKDEVKDIELVAIPKVGEPEGLFGDLPGRNLLFDWAEKVKAEKRMRWIKPNTSEIEDWPLNASGKYWRGLHPATNVKLDLFLVTAESWGPQMLIRTGPADFSEAIVTLAHDFNYLFYDGRILSKITGERLLTPEEADVFVLFGLSYIEPAERTEAKLRRLVPRRV